MLWADGDEGLVRPQGLEAERLAVLLTELHLKIQHVEQGDCVLERLLNRHVAVRDGQQQDLEVLSVGGEAEQDGEDVIDA